MPTLKSYTTESITEALKGGTDVNIPGVGKFKVVAKPARTARNPATGETVQVAAHKTVKFTLSKALKEAVNA